MSDSSIKEQMMQLTQQCILANDHHTALECLQIYKSSFGYDDFYITCLSSFSPTPEPLVSLIYIKQAAENESDCLKNLKLSNNYRNLEIICLSADNLLEDFFNYIATTSSRYLCFCDCNHKYNENRISVLISLFTAKSCID